VHQKAGTWVQQKQLVKNARRKKENDITFLKAVKMKISASFYFCGK